VFSPSKVNSCVCLRPKDMRYSSQNPIFITLVSPGLLVSFQKDYSFNNEVRRLQRLGHVNCTLDNISQWRAQ